MAPDWDGIAERYDDMFPASSRYLRTLELIVDIAAERDAGDVLDLGCGTGNLLAVLADRFPAARLVGVDPSSGMLERCRARFGSNGRVSLAAGDAASHPPLEACIRADPAKVT
ncbi:MAG: class I SAM-dependent methyltransferase [Actinobacteria bacterium]|nr:class I SAM-dependent methyltransferase [Actinomycetota bacterium]MBU1943169.1 class I SAM-dependent methyltransferase [Actinomycetota bacterium]MBU2687885.1 class I SAM-dependent methyltransferase [Actinomycetota bacterium]